MNADLEQYKLVGPHETPPIEVVLLENYQGESATDAYGIAEPSNIATAPAIANAVFNAIGVRLRALPMTPAAVLAALGKFHAEELSDATLRISVRPLGCRGGDARRPHRRRGNAVRSGAAAATDCVVMKAGGIDLLGLMKEGLLRPARMVNLRGVPGSRQRSPRMATACASARW